MGFIEDYFLNPILSNGWFNPVNSITYGIILVMAVYLVFRLLKRMNIHIDRYFLYAILPFIVWASSTRVLHDAAYMGALTGSVGEFYSLPFFPTPGSYMITFLLALAVLLVSLVVQKYMKFPYWKIMFVIGVVLDVINFALYPRFFFGPVFTILGLTALWTALFLLIHKFSNKLKIPKLEPVRKIFTLHNSTLLSAHMLDASATYVAMTFFGYLEQHPLPRFLIEMTNPAAMFALKLVVMIPILYMIDRYSEPGDFRNFLKIVILILGLAPGLRDMLRLMAMV